MKRLFAMAATTFVCAIALNAGAQTDDAASGAGADVRAPSPRMMDPNRPGYFQLGVGPAFPIGMQTDDMMVNVNAAYNRNFDPRFVGKIFGDANLGASSNTARLLTLGVGGEYYIQEPLVSYGVPYLGANVGFGFARNANERTADAATLGATTGFKFSTQALNVDINLNYSILTAQIDGNNPQVLALRAALAF